MTNSLDLPCGLPHIECRSSRCNKSWNKVLLSLAYEAIRRLSILLSSHNIVTLPRVSLRTEGFTGIGLQNDKTTTQDFNSSQILVGDHATSVSGMQARFVEWLVIRTLQATIYRLAPKMFGGVCSALMSSSQASILM
jgi:hypothetical protein